jgi:tetratricopeptide (TPR) repeat protein
MLDELRRDEGLRHFHRGLALERANRMSEAVEEYHQAIANYPQLREAHAALGFYYQRAGLLAKAAEEFRTVVSLEGDFLAYFNLGYALVELGRTDEALDAFQHCLHLEPDDPATHYEIAYIYYLQHEFETALDYLQSPLANYPEDWEVHNLIGKCYLGLREYDRALAAFSQGLLLTHMPQAQVELFDNIATVERHREFRTLRGDKDRVYASGGVVYLGSAQDNGIRIKEAADYHFTYPDIGTTLQRLLALRRGSDWQFTALIAIDKLAQPLTHALSHLLHVPVRSLAELTADDTALVVIAVAREAELLELALERTPCNTITFCLGVNWLRHSTLLPDLIGIVAQGACSVPWESEIRRLRADGAPPEQVTTCIESAAQRIIQAVHDTPPDANLPRQVRYYTRNHRRLSFSTSTL